MSRRTESRSEEGLEEPECGGDVSADFRDRLVGALEGLADVMECSGPPGLGGIVADWLLVRIDEPTAQRFARAGREIAGQIEAGLWDTSLPRCTADELLLQHAIDLAKWGAEEEGLDCEADARDTSEVLLMDDDVLLFWMPDAQLVFDGGLLDDSLSDAPSANPATWFDRFVTTGADRTDP